MVSLNEYLSNPCGTLSIPYWKAKSMTLPDNIKIVHEKDLLKNDLLSYDDVPYFRLFHPLERIQTGAKYSYQIKTADASDISLIIEIINKSYADISVTYEQIFGYTTTRVYNKNLWVILYDNNLGIPVGCGIADFDDETREGILEWIQVLPDHRRKGAGQAIVNELLGRLKEIAAFATVSGQTHNITSPESLYRKCGFIGNDIWHILTSKKI